MNETNRDDRLGEVLAAYLEATDAGWAPERRVLLHRYPDLRGELEAFFAAHDRVQILSRTLRPEETPAATPTLPSFPEGLAETPRAFGDYEELVELARGGMGIVYRARQKSLGRTVALKMLAGGAAASAGEVQRFRQEAEAAARMDHPNIVPIYEVGEWSPDEQTPAVPYFAMKLVEGGHLGDHLPRLAEDLRSGVALLARVARAVSYAHQRGILHRDLKPGNILLESPPNDATPPTPLVADFGLAKQLSGVATVIGTNLTQTGAIIGTPNYMAPEQAWGKPSALTTAADVYALGAILYELLTGAPPFQADNVLDTFVKLRDEQPVPPRQHNPRVDADLEIICLKCLEKEPGKRYASAAELADDLERYTNGEPIQARPAGRVERALKWARRRPAAAALLAVTPLAVLLLVLTLGGWWFTAQLQGALRSSEESRTQAESSAAIAHQEHERATASFQRGLQTIDDLLINLDGRLAQKSGMESVRFEFLGEFLRFSQQLQQERPTDAAARRQLGRIWARIGELRQQVGQFVEAEAALREVVEIQKALADEFPDQPQYRFDLAATHAQRARLLAGTRRTNDARGAYESASALAAELAAQNPGNLDFRQFAIRMRFEQANLAEESGKRDEARAMYEEALRRQEKLITDFPNSAPAHSFLGQIADSLASAVGDGEAAGAVRFLEMSLAAQREAWRLAPHVQQYSDDLRTAYNVLAKQLRALKRHADLAALADRLAADAPDVRTDTYNAACLMANAAEVAAATAGPAKSYAERAVKLLGKAVQSGYASKRNDREHMDRDPDLDPLRARPDYKALVARLDQRLPPTPKTPAQQFEALKTEYDSAAAHYRRALSEGTTVAQKRRARDQMPSVSDFARHFLELAEKNSENPAAVEALTWVLEHASGARRLEPGSNSILEPEAELLRARQRALEVLQRDHLDRPQLTELALSLARAAEPEGDKLLAAILEKHSEKKARGLAAFALGLSLAQQAERCRAADPDRSRQLSRRAERYLQQVVEQFDAVTLGSAALPETQRMVQRVDVARSDPAPLGSATLGDAARKKLHELRHLDVGSTAEEIAGEDLDGKMFKLSDYRGKVVVLDFWANWCGYCRMEYPFQRELVKRLEGKPFVFLGINCDDDREAVKKVVQRQGLNWRSWFDGGSSLTPAEAWAQYAEKLNGRSWFDGSTGGRIQRDWQIDSFPTLYVIDHKGVIRYKGLRGPQLEAAVNTLLAEREKEKPPR
jgi:serine/threonine-protein kinase